MTTRVITASRQGCAIGWALCDRQRAIRALRSSSPRIVVNARRGAALRRRVEHRSHGDAACGGPLAHRSARVERNIRVR
jgi:hypothetical protein